MRWTDKQREIADLINQGKTFKEIIAMGYSNNMVSRVTQALKRGEIPEAKPIETSPETTKTVPAGAKVMVSGKTPLAGYQAPKGVPPLIFTIGSKNIDLDFDEMYESWYFYNFLRERLGLTISFSATINQALSRLCSEIGSRAIIEGEKVKIEEVDHGRITGEIEPNGVGQE